MASAYLPDISTTAGRGEIYDSQEIAQKRNRLRLAQRGMAEQDQSGKSSSSEDEEESENLSTVGDIASPIPRRSSAIADDAATSSQLASIDEDSADERSQSTPDISNKTSKVTKRSPHASDHRHASTNIQQGKKPLGVRQQLGSLPNASLQSLISSLTTSSGSSGSSTATQRSYDKLAVRRRRPARRRVTKDIRRDIEAPRSREAAVTIKVDDHDTMDHEPNTDKSASSRTNRANMSRPVSTASRASRKDPIMSPSRRTSVASSARSTSHSRAGTSWMRQDTFNSDSGISVSSSPDDKAQEMRSPASRRRSSRGLSDEDSDDDKGDEAQCAIVPTLRASSAANMPAPSPMRALPDTDPFVQRLQDQEAAIKNHMLHSPQPKRSIRPQVNQLPSHRPSPALPLYDPRATSAVPSDHPFSSPTQPLPHGDLAYYQAYTDAYDQEVQVNHQPRFHLDLQKKTVAGYEKLADKLSHSTDTGETVVQPLYRRFERLNHRILLHLQDELSELEEELRGLDEMIAQTTAAKAPEESAMPPASRRADARYGSEFHFRRTQVLGKIYQKLQQYSKS